MVLIKGGTTTIGGGYQYEILGDRIHYLGHDLHFDSLNASNRALGEEPAPNNPTLQVTVADFYLSPTEVSNGEYLTFLIDSLLPPRKKDALQKHLKSNKKADRDAVSELLELVYKEAGQTALMPDDESWTEVAGFAFGEPLQSDYFKHPAYADYPVVGVTWFQARAYCAWLSRSVNAERARKNMPPLPDFRLPTEVEWEYAARGMAPQASEFGSKSTKVDQKALLSAYPWTGPQLFDAKAKPRANIRFEKHDFSSDEFNYTAPVRTYAPNGFGLYNMAGNVSEWVEDVFRIRQYSNPKTGFEGPGIQLDYGSIDVRNNPRVIKGGSWADYHFAAMCGSRSGIYQDDSSVRVGFRVARSWVRSE